MCRCTLRVVISLCAVAATAPAAAVAQDPPLAGLDAYVRRVLRDWEAPGIAVAVVKDDEVVLAKGYGVRELGGDEPLDEHSLFAIASTSKAFTAAAVAMLVDQGALGWDDRVIDRLQGFRLSDPYASQELRIRDLLSHRSGLPRGDRLWYAAPFDRDEVLQRVRLLEPASSFRSRYGYQNIMFLAAGELVEAITDTSWDDFLRIRIFEPLGMHRTRTTVRGLDALGNLATPHGRIDEEVVPIPWRNFDNLGGAGSIVSSVADMAQWMRLQLGEGEYEGRRLLSDSVVREMRTPHTAIPNSEANARVFPESHLQAYGLGWFLQDYRGRLVVRHSGSLDGMRTHVILVPEEELGVVAITNLAESRIPQAVVWHVVDQYLGPRDKDWNAVFLAEAEHARVEADSARASREAERLENTTPSHSLDQFAGKYESALYGTAEVHLEGDGLVLSVGPAYVGGLEHWHLNTFRVNWDDRYLGRDWVSFRLSRMGDVAALDVEGFGTFSRRHDSSVR